MSRTRIPAELRRRVAGQARHRCGYCLTAESIIGYPMEVDHIIPEADGGSTEEDNLWLACSACNDRKNDRTMALDLITQQRVRLFDPRHQVWAEHFYWSEDGGQINGRTAIGRATVEALGMNDLLRVQARWRWVSVGWHPPQD